MSIPFYAKSPNNQGYIKNMEVVGFCDLNGVNAFQMALYKTEEGRYYMYCGSFRGPGWNVVDVTDPTQPRVVNWLEACDPKEYPATNTPKIQVADGLMIGATGGGGQPIVDGIDLNVYRGAALWKIDRDMDIRFSHENPDILDLYRLYLGKPMSEKPHHLLHTDHHAWQMPRHMADD